jgi:hypothetical protein
MASVWVRFSPGFPAGGGFPTEQLLHVVLCMNRIPPEKEKRFPEVLCVFSNSARAKIRQFDLRKLLLSAAGNLPPRGNPGLRHTRANAILKKFDRKMEFYLK